MELNINPELIQTEGKFDQDLLEDAALVLVDMEIDALDEAEEDLILGGKNDDMSLVDIIAGDDPDFIILDKETPKIEVDDLPTRSQR